MIKNGLLDWHTDCIKTHIMNQIPIGSILPPDDLRVGAFVLVHSTVTTQQLRLDALKALAACKNRSSPSIGFGIPLRIQAVDLPFLVCAVLQPGGAFTGPAILDVRKVRLVAASRKFVQAISGFQKKIVTQSISNVSQSCTDSKESSEASTVALIKKNKTFKKFNFLITIKF